MEIKERYIDPFTDFGFKKLFGSEPNKDLLMDFLNELLKGREEIKELTYSKNEHLGKGEGFRRAVFDLYCENENGEKFIIELQKAKQQYFKDRSIYYATFPIQEQGQKGEGWNYRLKDVYAIGIMDFKFDDSHPGQFHHEVKLVEQKNHEVFYDKLTFIYLEMPKFDKDETSLETHFDKWMYLLKNLNKFTEIPSILQEKVFRKVFEIAEVSKLNAEEMKTYEASLKEKRDWQNVLDTAVEEAMEKGIEKGKKEEKLSIARHMKAEGLPVESISRVTGLSVGEIEKL